MYLLAEILTITQVLFTIYIYSFKFNYVIVNIIWITKTFIHKINIYLYRQVQVSCEYVDSSIRVDYD